MCNKQQIKQKIVELEEVKSTYTRFINDFDTQKCVENTTWAEKNKEIIKKVLRNLYISLYQKQGDAPKELNKIPEKIKPITNTDEISAILHFNNDKRFSITE